MEDIILVEIIIDFLCTVCQRYTHIKPHVAVGKNTFDLTCSCGQKWTIFLLEVTSIDPVIIRHYEVSRIVGTLKGEMFHTDEIEL